MTDTRAQKGRDNETVHTGWWWQATVAGAVATPATLPATGWHEAIVPGTVAGAGRRAGIPPSSEAHAQDHWFRCDTPLPRAGMLDFDGLATLAEIWLDGEKAAGSESMFRPLAVPVPRAGARLHLCFRALRPRLAARGAMRPPRWRGRLAETEALRGLRTTLLGHMPGWHPPVPVIGPYRPIRLQSETPGHALTATLDNGVGRITVRLTGPGLAARRGTVAALGRTAPLSTEGDALVATLDLPDPPLWWPHTHGTPHLVDVAAELDGETRALGQVGFRTIARRAGNGFGLLVNGVELFCRGAIWTGIDPVTLPCDEATLLPALQRARDAGMTMLRVPGFALYESQGFFEACDRLGLLVWHDFMFARFDYPADPAFLEEARREAEAFLMRTQSHPSLAVLCGGNEVTQAAAMAGRPPADWNAPLFTEVLAGAAARLRPDVPYVPNAPHGGTLPFAADAPVAHYFGVGGYLRPPEDLASAGVNFAAECLAFANPPDPAACRALGAVPGADPRWRAGVPRDLSAAWDFADVRDHYVATLFGVDPARLRRDDPQAWLEHGRAAVALLVEAALGTWRTDGRCAGALVLGFHDLAPGAGWGMLGHDGRPKSAWHAFRRLAQPVQVVLRDMGQNGIVVHALNETDAARTAQLALLGLDPTGQVETLGEAMLTLPARGHVRLPAVALMGRFRDIGHAWRFGPPGFTVLGARLVDDDAALLSEATLFPAGPALPPTDLGLTAQVSREGEGWVLTVGAARFAQFVQVDDDSCVAEDDHFHLWPGQHRRVHLTPQAGRAPQGSVSALNGLAAAHYGGAA